MSTYTHGRLINRQRQLGEQGRLRFGQMVTGTRKNGSTYTRPSSTLTWIVTSYSQEHVQTAATLWGGQVERWKPQGHGAEQWRVITDTNEIPAILPPGNPLFQAYELWSGGGCQRRCNGEVEELSGSLCICRAQFGDAYHEQKQGTVCDDKTRLKVIIPDMPGIGSWRMETGSFYAADEIAGFVDLVRATVGDQVLVPIKLTLIQDTVTRDGETKQFVRPKVDLRGRTAGELLSGVPSLAPLGSGASPQAISGNGPAAISAPAKRPAAGDGQAAIEARQPATQPTADTFIASAAAAKTLDDLSTNLQTAQRAGFARNLADASDPVAAAFMKRRTELAQPAQQTPAATPSMDPDLIWQQIVAASPWPMSELKERFITASGGIAPEDAGVQDLGNFLGQIKTGATA